MAWQRVRIELPPGLPPDDRVAIASDIIEFIKSTAQDAGKGYNPDSGRLRKFPGYSKEYAKRKGQHNVDLTLSDNMLRDMRLLSHKSDSLLIGFEKGTTSNDKAEGNQRGTYGRPSPIPGKARPFLGITKADLGRIIRRYEEE